jgi:hypothetical protein
MTMNIKIIIAGAAILTAATAFAVAQTTPGTPPSGSGTHSRTRGAVATPAPAPARPAAASARTQQPAPAARPAPRDQRLAMAIPDAKGYRRLILLRALDKITGRAIDLAAPAGRTVTFATLSIVARYCHARPPDEPPDSSAFLQIRELKPNEPPVTVFSGWMFAASPSINGLEHPVYDVWVISCITDEPAPAPPPPPVVARAHRPSVSAAPDSIPPGATVTPAPDGGGAAPSETALPEAAPQPDIDEPVEEDVGVGDLPSR